jgi:phosphoadenosine phosphosulfate reductase
MNERLQGPVIELALTLRSIAAEHAPAALASSLGAEDMVLTDVILRHDLDIGILTLDTGRLHPETRGLLDAIERRYGCRPEVRRPQPDAVAEYGRKNGADAFHVDIDLRKRCCAIRKAEPLRRALAGKRAWITGLRRAQAVTRRDFADREFDVAEAA